MVADLKRNRGRLDVALPPQVCLRKLLSVLLFTVRTVRVTLVIIVIDKVPQVKTLPRDETLWTWGRTYLPLSLLIPSLLKEMALLPQLPLELWHSDMPTGTVGYGRACV